MIASPRLVLVAVALGAGLTLSACQTTPPAASATTAAAAVPDVRNTVARPLDVTVEDRILALDPDAVTGRDVRETLQYGPVPRIMLLHGGVYGVHLLMESFAEFLAAMGYPIERIRDAGDGELSYSPYASAATQAGILAWYYEQEGVRAMLVGHSQGGIQTVKILHELAGTYGDHLHVVNPVTERDEARTTIVDPLTGRERPVIGLSVAYASVVGTGGWSLALPVHWTVIPHARTIPDSVDEFTSYRIGVDFFAWDIPGLESWKTFKAEGKTNVRNLTLPASYSHVFVPGTAHLAEDPAMRAWIDAFDPRVPANWTPPPELDRASVLWAADVWHSVKKHWTLEAQRLIRARRATQARP
jgi:hypothetical protein